MVKNANTYLINLQLKAAGLSVDMWPFIGHQGTEGFHLLPLIFCTFEAYKTFKGGYRTFKTSKMWKTLIII